MKSAKSTDSLKSWVKKLLKEVYAGELLPLDPRRAVVRAVLSADTSEARADEAMKVIDAEFVDLNEVRVATELELQAMLGPKYPDIERRVARMLTVLNAIFDKEGTLSFERIKALPKKEARAWLRELPDMTPYVEAYLMMYGLESPAMPVDDELVLILNELGHVEDGQTAFDVQKHLEAAAKPEDLHALHVGARKLVSERSRRKKG